MKNCYCEAYPFPHRRGGGKCEDPERVDEEAADRWLLRLMERGYRNIDEYLDDPRHVPYSQQRKP